MSQDVVTTSPTLPQSHDQEADDVLDSLLHDVSSNNCIECAATDEFDSDTVDDVPIYSMWIYSHVLPHAGSIAPLHSIVPKVQNHFSTSLPTIDDEYLHTWQHHRHMLNKLRTCVAASKRGDVGLTLLESDVDDPGFCPPGITATTAIATHDDDLLSSLY